jgi:hypothetical protein
MSNYFPTTYFGSVLSKVALDSKGKVSGKTSCSPLTLSSCKTPSTSGPHYKL